MARPDYMAAAAARLMPRQPGPDERIMWPRLVLSACLAVLTAILPVRAAAQPVSQPVSAEVEADAVPAKRRHPRRIYAGMWTTHLKDDVLVIDNNWALGLTAGGYFAAAFLNSYGELAFAGGLQRTFLSSAPGPVVVSAGYRLGAITGYDGRLMDIARKTPVLPLVQPFAMIDVHRIGIEVSCTFVVVSVATSFRF